MGAEFAAYTNSTTRFFGGMPYVVRLEPLLGSFIMRDPEKPDVPGYPVRSSETRPSELIGVSVSGTNLIVSLKISTNIVANIAFDKHIRPVWATTNGVSIGLIPTNCVIYREVVTNRLVRTVVY